MLEAASVVAAVSGGELVSACATVAPHVMVSVEDVDRPIVAVADITRAPVPASFASSRRVKSVVMVASLYHQLAELCRNAGESFLMNLISE
jgi:hypothetical protein